MCFFQNDIYKQIVIIFFLKYSQIYKRYYKKLHFWIDRLKEKEHENFFDFGAPYYNQQVKQMWRGLVK